MPRATALPSAERRARAIEALLDLGSSCAPEQITTAAIAERMGLSHAALFRHFPSREALWAESMRWATAQLEQATAQGQLNSPLPPEDLAGLLLAPKRDHAPDACAIQATTTRSRPSALAQ